MNEPESTRIQGPKLRDLVGLVVGYAMAGLLVRSFWSDSRPLVGIPAIALLLEFLWLGLAMSGPIVLLLGHRGRSTPPSETNRLTRPKRPGRLISDRSPPEPPVGRGPANPVDDRRDPYTRAELAWLLIGGYWIGLTLFVVPALSVDTPWALVGLLQMVAALGLAAVVGGRGKPNAPADSWTHVAAVSLLWSWPFAWICLILLSRSI
jgi:hypothetical protein